MTSISNDKLSFFFRMADSVVVCSDVTSVGEQSESEASSLYKDGKHIPTVSVAGGAKSAKDLVKGQEKLLTKLQDLKYELDKMDRESSRIREDVVRSKQMFNTIFDLPPAQNIKHTSDTFRSTRPSSSTLYRHTDADLKLSYLNKIATYAPKHSFSSSGRGEHRSTELDDIRQRAARFTTSMSQASLRNFQNYTSDEQYSGTESDAESLTSSHYPSRSSAGSLSESTYQGSSESVSEDAGSSTESNVTIGNRPKTALRRTSYFYKQFGEASN